MTAQEVSKLNKRINITKMNLDLKKQRAFNHIDSDLLHFGYSVLSAEWNIKNNLIYIIIVRHFRFY